MPGGDRTGPMGFGPMTGRAAGFCAGYGVPGYSNPGPWPGWGGPGWGYGRGGWGPGRGFGRGMGYGFRGRGRGRGRTVGATGFPGWPPFGWAPGWSAGFDPWTTAPPDPKDELEALRHQAEYLERSLDDIRKRMDELDAESSKERNT